MKIAQRIKIGDVCSFLNGGTPSKSVERYFQGNNPWITGADITSPVVTKARSYITNEAIEGSATNLVPSGTVLLVTRTSVGKVAIAGIDLCFSQDITALTPDTSRLHAPYLVEFLKTQESHFESQARGATIKGITRQVVEELEIPLPPLEEQKRIAEVLDKAEELRAKRRAALTQLETLSQSIFLEMFGDPAQNPQKWSRLKLVDVCSSPGDIKCGPFGTQLSCSEFREEGVPLWGIKNVNRYFELPTHEFLDARTAQRLIQYSIKSGDIVMTRKGTVGNCAVYPSDFPLGIMHSDLLRLRVEREKCDPIFLSHQLHYSRDVATQLALISGGAVMPGINVTKLKSLEVLIPGIVLQREFANRVSAVEKLKATQRASLAELDTLFASLQQKAFSGEF